MRIDRWLFAARFFRSRSLAADAVTSGRVRVSGQRAKPGRRLALGDIVTIAKGPYDWTLVVRGLTERRGPAREATLLYEETAASRLRREQVASELRIDRMSRPIPGVRPTKRDRRRVREIVGKG